RVEFPGQFQELTRSEFVESREAMSQSRLVFINQLRLVADQLWHRSQRPMLGQRSHLMLPLQRTGSQDRLHPIRQVENLVYKLAFLSDHLFSRCGGRWRA